MSFLIKGRDRERFAAPSPLFARSLTSLSLFLPLFLSLPLSPFTGIYEKKILSKKALAPLAAAYVGYIVLNNLNLQLNTVGFYQITKIAVAPAVLLAEAVFLGKRSSRAVTASIGVVCAGVALATVTDPQLVAGDGGGALLGLLVGAGAIAATTAYQIWAGTKQRELSAGSMQLLDQYAPIAAGMLSGLVLLREPIGKPGAVPPDPDTLLGFPYSAGAVAAIAVSAGLGLLVSLSTFLVIGATSSLTYNVVGHVKTVIILGGGCLFFGDEMPPKKLAGEFFFFFFFPPGVFFFFQRRGRGGKETKAHSSFSLEIFYNQTGISMAFVGIVWYSQLKMAEAAAASSAVGEFFFFFFFFYIFDFLRFLKKKRRKKERKNSPRSTSLFLL